MKEEQKNEQELDKYINQIVNADCLDILRQLPDKLFLFPNLHKNSNINSKILMSEFHLPILGTEPK